MEIKCGKFGGFCHGVNYAVNKALEVLNSNNGKRIYCLGQLVHNETVISDLESKGMITINSLDEALDNSKVIFRAHGEAEEVYQKAQEKNLDIIDLTCGKVLLIHNKITKQKEKAYIIIIGKKDHPEIIGTSGFAGKNSIVIESINEIPMAYKMFQKSHFKKIYIVSQTTFLV